MRTFLKTINLKVAAALLMWSVTVVTGLVYLNKYSLRPGTTAISPAFIPERDLYKKNKNLPTLIVFAHPQCPCTRATVRELEQLVAHSQGLVEVRVLFLQPTNELREWVESSLWQQTSKIPHVSVAAIGETELEQFGEVTSGQVMLYDIEGRLIFSGGITDGRGHEGFNAGRSAIEGYLHGNQISIRQTPVFGCALTASEKNL